MTTHEEQCACEEYRELSRRGFIGATGVAAGAALLPGWLPEIKYAESQNSSRDVIVSVFLRGGADGLTMVAPFADADYYRGRPAIAVPRPDTSASNRGTALDNFFMFPPGMMGLYPAWQAQNLAIVHATGQLGTNSRSHFEAERYMEAGKPNDYNLVTGWLARHLMSSAPMRAGAPLRALALGWGGMRLTLSGAPNTLPIPEPPNYTMARNIGPQLDRLYTSAWAPARNAARDGISTINLLQSINFRGYVPSNGAVYPNTDFGRGFRSLAALIKADVGVEAAHLDIGGWDTHAQQGSTGGVMHNLMVDFSNTLGAFWADIIKGPTTRRLTVVCISEFGRNARENGSQGTDHGRAGAAFFLGTHIRGGRVISSWPGLDRAVLEDGQDLRVTIDYRDLLAEIVQRRLNNPNLDLVFPGYVPVERGITL